MTEPASIRDELVSVVIPVFNGAHVVTEAIGSVLDQRHRRLELIVIDDGSTDDSADAARSVADDRTVVISTANGGSSVARNIGLARARGSFVAFLDADDLWLPDRLTRQLEAFDADPGLEVVGHLMRYENLDGRVLGVTGEVLDAQGAARLRAGRFLPFQISSALFRTQTVRDLDGFDASMPTAEDLDLYVRLAQNGRFETINEVLGVYRIHPDSISATQFDRQRKMVRYIAARTEARSHGGDLSLAEFESTYSRSLNDRRQDRVRALYRATGLAVAERNWPRAFSSGIGALALGPVYTVGRIRKQQRSVEGLDPDEASSAP